MRSYPQHAWDFLLTDAATGSTGTDVDRLVRTSCNAPVTRTIESNDFFPEGYWSQGQVRSSPDITDLGAD